MKWKINLLAPFLIAFTIWAGVTGRVGWWTIAVVVLSHAELNITITI